MSVRKINKQLHETSNVLQDNLSSLINRGENLHELEKAANNLRDTSLLFKKTARKLNVSKSEEHQMKEQEEADYRTENEQINIKEYELHLQNLLKEGQYQYVLDKSSQLGLLDFVKYVITISSTRPLNLSLSEALKSSSHLGHLLIVELLDHDIDNEKYYGMKPRDASQSIFYPLIDDLVTKVPYSNLPLTHIDLMGAIKELLLSQHHEVHNVLQAYYLQTYAIKERYNRTPPTPQIF
jgi:hypothetical protein